MKSAKLSLQQKLKCLREQIPLLNYSEVRRFKIPLYEALLLELQENNFPKSFAFFSELIQSSVEPNVLKKNKLIQEKVFEELKRAEQCVNSYEEIKVLSELAKSVEEHSWLADKIYQRTMAQIDERSYVTRSDTFARYLYGSFLSRIDGRLQESISMLEEAFKYSYGIGDWTAEVNAEAEQILLSTLAGIQLCRSLNKLSAATRTQNVEKSFELANEALTIAEKLQAVGEVILKVQSLIEVGICLHLLGRLDEALERCRSAFDIAEKGEFHELGFKALMLTAKCYKDSNDERLEEVLNHAKDFAAKNSLIAEKAKALVELGKVCSVKVKAQEALTHLEESANIFMEIKRRKKLQEVRMLSAPLISAELSFNRLVETILKCDREPLGNNRQLERLLLWYDRKYAIHNRHHEFYKEQDDKANPEEL